MAETQRWTWMDVLPESLWLQTPDERWECELFLLDVDKGGLAVPGIQVKISTIGTQAHR